MRQRLSKKRSPEWLALVQAEERAIEDLRHAWEVLGLFNRQLEGWNREHEGSCGHIGDANLGLARDFIMGAVQRLKMARKGVV